MIQICPPYLHILLGLVKKQHDLLESKTHAIDRELADEIARSNTKLGNTVFELYVQQRRTLFNLQKKKQFLEGRQAELEGNDEIPLNRLRQQKKNPPTETSANFSTDRSQ